MERAAVISVRFVSSTGFVGEDSEILADPPAPGAWVHSAYKETVFLTMKASLRSFFDAQLEITLREMPPRAHELLAQVPLVVEDHPSRQVMRQMRVRRRGTLCGLYSGIPLTDRSVEHSGVLSDVIHIYRQGIIELVIDQRGTLDETELRHQIRLTVLHELGHHHGLAEKELRELGY